MVVLVEENSVLILVTVVVVFVGKCLDSWKNQTDYMFCLSLQGYGIDCHRTYETLVLGSIPIVNRNSISLLFENLSVIIIDK